MKTMKRFASVLLALVMIMGMTITTYATEADLSGHTYAAYQIFSGTQAQDSDKLGNITWGSGVNGANLLTALKADSTVGAVFASCTTAQDVANAMTGWGDSSDNAKIFAKLAYANKTGTGTTCVNGTTSLEAGYYLVVDNTNLGTGTDTVYNLALLQLTNKGTFEIATKVDVPEVEKTVSEEDADANIGDTVTFTLTATMPSTFEGYETYKVVFHDTLSAGLDFTEGTVKVTVNGVDKTTAFTTTESNGTLTISCDDVLVQGATASSKIVVTYDAVLDSDAVIGTTGNPNEVYLEYSNDPNWDEEGTEPTGNTPKDEVEVYTWEIPVFKFTGTDTPLAGAGFTLYKDEACTQAVTVTKDTTVTDKNVYKVDPNSTTAEISTDSTGRFEIEGLEKGTYYLKETTTPAGYNTCDVVTVVIGENGALTKDGETTGEIAILNNSGATLPETGGIGTTIFYSLGTALMLAAGVLLVTKKRMAE